MTTLERIKQDAAWKADTSSNTPWEASRMRYVWEEAAKSERNKLIEEIIEQVNAVPMFPENRKEWLTYLYSLKV